MDKYTPDQGIIAIIEVFHVENKKRLSDGEICLDLLALGLLTGEEITPDWVVQTIRANMEKGDYTISVEDINQPGTFTLNQ